MSEWQKEAIQNSEKELGIKKEDLYSIVDNYEVYASLHATVGEMLGMGKESKDVDMIISGTNIKFEDIEKWFDKEERFIASGAAKAIESFYITELEDCLAEDGASPELQKKAKYALRLLGYEKETKDKKIKEFLDDLKEEGIDPSEYIDLFEAYKQTRESILDRPKEEFGGLKLSESGRQKCLDLTKQLYKDDKIFQPRAEGFGLDGTWSILLNCQGRLGHDEIDGLLICNESERISYLPEVIKRFEQREKKGITLMTNMQKAIKAEKDKAPIDHTLNKG